MGGLFMEAAARGQLAPAGGGKSRTHKNARQNRAFCIDLINERGK